MFVAWSIMLLVTGINRARSPQRMFFVVGVRGLNPRLCDFEKTLETCRVTGIENGFWFHRKCLVNASSLSQVSDRTKINTFSSLVSGVTPSGVHGKSTGTHQKVAWSKILLDSEKTHATWGRVCVGQPAYNAQQQPLDGIFHDKQTCAQKAENRNQNSEESSPCIFSTQLVYTVLKTGWMTLDLSVLQLPWHFKPRWYLQWHFKER